MNKMLIVVLLFWANSAYAVTNVDLTKIAMIESSNNPKAYNTHSKAIGLYQITPICLKDYEQYHGKKHASLWDAKFNTEVANWYLNVRIPRLLKHYGFEDNDRNRIIAYNAGIRALITNKIPKETLNYLKKYAVK